MARFKQRGNEVRLRKYLLEEAVDLRALHGSMIPEAIEGLSKTIDALRGGQRVTFNRFELPEDHPCAAPAGGDACDRLTLTVDNELVVAGADVLRRAG